MRKIKAFNVLLGVFVLIAFSLLLFLNLTNKDIASAQTCQEHKVVCDDGKVPCCEKFKPHCKDGEPKCCKKKEDGGLKCHDKEGNIYPVECKDNCDENVTEEDETVVESEVLSEPTIEQQSTETIETTTRASVAVIGAPGCSFDTPDCNIVGPGIPNNMCGYCYSSTSCRLVDAGAGDWGRRDTSARARYFSAFAYTAFQGNAFVPFCPQNNYNPGDCTCNCGPPTIPGWGNVGCGTGAYCRIDGKCGRECNVDPDCTVSLKGKKCSAGRCGCSGTADCSAGQTCFSGICVGCLLDTEPGGYDPLTKCFPGKLCRVSDHKCVNCLSNTDCSTFVCDTTSTSPTYGSCVQCLVDSHCVGNPNGTRCDPLDHLCKKCYISGGTTYGCSSSAPICNTLTNPPFNNCVQCTAANTSVCTGSTPICDTVTNTCIACPAATPAWNITTATCVQCTAANTSACTGGTPACNTSTNTCVQCTATNTSACTGGTPVCNTLTNTCVQCTATNTSACTGSTPVCNTVTNTCVACPAATPVWNSITASCVQCTAANTSACTGSTPVCNTATNTCVPAAPPCGALGQSCCSGSICNNGYVCVSGTCSNPQPPPLPCASRTPGSNVQYCPPASDPANLCPPNYVCKNLGLTCGCGAP